jgi:quercetin dioxygenase-like cupin family protein
MEAKMVLRRALVLVARAFCSIAISHSAAGATVGKLSQNDSAVSPTMAMSHDGAGTTNDGKSIRDVSVVEQLPDDHPTGAGAIITAVSIRRAKDLNDATLSTFLVDYPPGASAVLHRMPAPGYVLVHVLSGTIHASAWHAGVGIYHTGETWVEPAFANNIATANSSAQQPARALVILVTEDPGTQTNRSSPIE